MAPSQLDSLSSPRWSEHETVLLESEGGHMSRMVSGSCRRFTTLVGIAAVVGLAACSGERVTGVAGPSDGGQLTIPHDYIIYRTAAEYKEAFLRAQREKGANFSCEMTSRNAPTRSIPATTLQPPSSAAKTVQVDDPFFRVGAIWVYNLSYIQTTTNNGIDWGFFQGFYASPGRFAGNECDASGWRYGGLGYNQERAAVDDGYGNKPWPNPPVDPPPGVDAEEYGRLTPGEQELMWWKFYHSTPAQFAEFVSAMIRLRSDAIDWAASEQPTGETDGPQDAFRHAYWMCTMERELGEQFARDWGWAHEEGGTDGLAGMMDLHNNYVGRLIGTTYNGTCEDGVRQAYTAGWLIIQKGFLPNRDAPQEPNPPGSRPPLEQ